MVVFNTWDYMYDYWFFFYNLYNVYDRNYSSKMVTYYNSIILNGNNQAIGLEQVAINGQNVIIRQRVDDGLISLVSAFDFIDNYNIGEFDHAEILWQIVRGKPALLSQSNLPLPQSVWLIHSSL